MTKFIELRRSEGNRLIMINLATISYFQSSGTNHLKTTINFAYPGKEGGKMVTVEESYEEVKKLIYEAQ
jgi:hypothetical protein